MSSLVKYSGDGGQLEALSPIMQRYIEGSKAENTWRAYRADWRDFVKWCQKESRQPLPASPETVADYLEYLAKEENRKASTLQRRLTAIQQVHKWMKVPSPTATEEVRTAWATIRRRIGTAQTGKAPAMLEDIRRMVDTLPDCPLGVRDRALLLLGFAGAFRRSELVALNVEDIETTTDGLVVHLRRSKTDQEGQGRKVGIPYGSNPATCPVRSLQKWLTLSGITAGPLFRSVNRHGQISEKRLSDKAVALVVKRAAEAAGLDPKKYSGHSLRAGLATSAAAAGKSERSIMAQTGHKSVNMVRRYIRDGNLFRDNAAAGIGL